LQSIIEDSLPKAGEEIQNFLAKQGQNAEEVLQTIQDFVKNAIDEDISKKLESLQNQKEPDNVTAKLVQDVTIVDGSIIDADAPFLKIWELKNDGNCAWPKGTELRPISAIRLSPEPFYVVPSVEAGESVRVNVELVAPSQPGKYRSFYRLFRSDTNSPFGDIIWVDIVVPFPYKFQEQLHQLIEMGFEESICRFLLDEHNGSIDECMTELAHA